MKNIILSTCLGVISLVATSVQGAIYSSEASFQGALIAGYDTETFSGAGNDFGSYSFGNANYTGVVTSTPNTTWAGAPGVAFDELAGGSITINTFTGGVNSVGAYFYATDGGTTTGQAAGNITVTFNYTGGGSHVETATLIAGSKPYFGWTNPGGPTISSVVLTGGNATYFNSLDNVTIGVAAVPEPATWGVFMGIGLALFGAARRLRK